MYANLDEGESLAIGDLMLSTDGEVQASPPPRKVIANYIRVQRPTAASFFGDICQLGQGRESQTRRSQIPGRRRDAVISLVSCGSSLLQSSTLASEARDAQGVCQLGRW